MQKKGLIKIGDKYIGEGYPCFIIAEAGANFRISENPEVNFKRALKLIDVAVDAKTDAVKFQLYSAKKLYVKNAGSAKYIGKKKPIFEIIKEMELPKKWLPKLKKYCDDKGIIFLCTPFDEESTDVLEEVGIEAYEIASYSITHLPLLKYIAKKGKPIIISSGASNIEDIENAIKIIKNQRDNPIALMQCTAKYPAPLSTINLKTIPHFIKKLNIPIGLSDHSRNPIIAPLGATALGAKIIEKHFTIDNQSPGPDHAFAILPNELKNMVHHIRSVEEALGSKQKRVLEEEKELHDFARRYIYAKEDIKKGNIFSDENLVVLRSGRQKKGMLPSELDRIKGKKASKNIKEQEPIMDKCIHD